jgi:catechol 2,3-dioxygenase-like lactoylglutathione lyase family enzyme
MPQGESLGCRERLHREEDAMAATGIFYVFAFVSDLARSKRFYGETLGWKLVIHTDDRHEEARCYAGGMQVEVRVDDVDAEHERLRKLGVAVSDLDDQPWGERNFFFVDPDGYRWSYGQATREGPVT